MRRVNLVCALFGGAFGFVFAAAGFNQYDVIHRMLLLKDVKPFLVMGSAVGTAMALLWLLERRGWTTPLGGALSLRRWNVEPKQVWGGVIFGSGWAITGACPGTASTMLGGGSLMGIVLAAGIIAGIALRDLAAKRTERPKTAPASDAIPVS